MRLGRELPRGWRAVGWIGVAVGIAAALSALPPFEARNPLVPVLIGLFSLTVGIGSWIRGERRVGAYAVATGFSGLTIGYLATVSSIGNLEAVVVWGALLSATLVSATPLVVRSPRGALLRALGCRQHRARGDDADGRVLCGLGRRHRPANGRSVCSSESLAGASLGLLHAFFSVTLRADQIVGRNGDQFPRARDHRLPLHPYLRRPRHSDRRVSRPCPTPLSTSSTTYRRTRLGGFSRRCLRNTDYIIWMGLASSSSPRTSRCSRRPPAFGFGAVGEHPRAADTVGINVYGTRYACVMTLSGALAAAGGVVPRTRIRRTRSSPT